MLEVEDLTVTYGQITALEEVSLSVNAGEHVAVLGPNGAGKTTLMRTIFGHLAPDRGTISIGGEDITDLPSWERAKRGLAIVPEGGHVFPDATVAANLRTAAFLQRDRAELSNRRKQVFELFPVLEERAGQRAGTLSGGEQQMLAIGRAFMTDPAVLLIDEITMGLMPKLVTEMFAVLGDLNDRGIAMLQVEQNVRKTLELVDRAYVLENGSVIGSGTPRELRDSGAIEASYLGVSEEA